MRVSGSEAAGNKTGKYIWRRDEGLCSSSLRRCRTVRPQWPVYLPQNRCFIPHTSSHLSIILQEQCREGRVILLSQCPNKGGRSGWLINKVPICHLAETSFKPSLLSSKTIACFTITPRLPASRLRSKLRLCVRLQKKVCQVMKKRE